jgi:hypothetical protein
MTWEAGTKDFSKAKMRKTRWASPMVKLVEATLHLVYFAIAAL